MKRTIYAIGFLFFVNGCSNSTDIDPPQHLESVPPTTLMPVDLSHTGMPLVAMVAHKDEYKMDIRWNETFGRLELRDDFGLDIFVKQDTLSCTSKKEEIEASIFNIEYSVFTDTLICYSASLPDGAAKYRHIFASFNIGGTPYTFENNPLVECSLEDIDHMTEIITQMEAIQASER
jgi:hypothetical protein